MDEIVGDTIILRKYEMDDAKSIFQWRNDIDTTIYMGKKFRNPATFEQVSSSVSEVINSESKDSLFLVIANKKNRDYIGGIGLTSIDKIDRTSVLSMVIGQEKDRNKGIASEAMKLLLNYAFKNLKLHKVELNVYEKNIPAIKCYQKNGFIHEGTSRDHMVINGEYENLVHMGILEVEFLN